MTEPIGPVSPASMVIDVDNLPDYIKVSQKNALDHALNQNPLPTLKAKEKKEGEFEWLLSKALKALGTTYANEDDLHSARGKMADMMKNVIALAASEKNFASIVSTAGNFNTLSAAFKSTNHAYGASADQAPGVTEEDPSNVQNLARGIKNIVSNWNPTHDNQQQLDSEGQSEYVSISSAANAMNQQGTLSQSNMDKLAKQNSSVNEDESTIGTFIGKLASGYVGNQK